MKKITIIDDMGIPREYTYSVTKSMFDSLPVDQFDIRAKNDHGVPYQIQILDLGTEVKVLFQHNNGNPAVSKKNIFGGMLPELYAFYNKPIISSSFLYPTVPNERRIPATAGKMYNKLLGRGIVFIDQTRDIFYYKN